jgi:N-hydroxyarylamine O-acetyltransferase
MNVPAIIDRIQYSGALLASDQVLAALHRAWVLAVPFENLDIHVGRPIVLEEARFFDKVVNDRRGGFCFEMNGLFASLLRAIGFDVTLMSARVFDANEQPGREFAHLCLKVTTPTATWLADVGFGDAFSEPLRLEPGLVQLIDGDEYRIVIDGEQHIMQRRSPEEEWRSRYAFTLVPRRLSDFCRMCDDFQTNPESAFRKRPMCTRLTLAGRITLAGDKLITTIYGNRSESVVPDATAFATALREHFAIALSEDQLQQLWRACAAAKGSV